MDFAIRLMPTCAPVRSVTSAVGVLALLLLLLFTGSARGADYYACDCAAGAATGCVAGSDAASGTSPAAAWRSYDRAQDAWSALAAGDTLRFCRGGVFPIAGSTRWVNAQCRAAQPCTVMAYTADWSQGGEDLPRLERASGDAISLENGGDARHEEGYVFRDLELACTACAGQGSGVFLYNDVDDVRLEDLRIRGFGVGVFHGGSRACTADAAGCDARNVRLSLRGSDIRDNDVQGFLGAGDDLLIDGNRFEGNGRSGILEHNVYISGDASRVVVSRNELYRSAARTGRCEGASLVAHGSLTDLTIEGNFLHEDIGAASPSCWGINISPAYASGETFLRTIVRGNRLHNLGNAAIALTSCVDCVVENNLILHEQPFGITAIHASALTHEPNDATLQRLRVRNNSIQVGAAGGVGIRVGGEGTQHEIVSNALRHSAASGGAGGGSWACLALDLPAGAYAAVDHNVCGYAPGAAREWEQGSGSLANWRVLSGFDAHSRADDPGFAGAFAGSFDFAAANLAVAMISAGHPRFSATTDFYGSPRTRPADAGALQNADRLFADGYE
jgi:hypothetical protein